MHRFLPCTVCGLDGTTVPTLPGWNDDYPLVMVFESLCLLRSVASLYTVSLGVPGLPGPHGFWVFLSCCDEIPSLWISSLQSGAILFGLFKMREVTFDALVQRTLHPPRILRNPVS